MLLLVVHHASWNETWLEWYGRRGLWISHQLESPPVGSVEAKNFFHLSIICPVLAVLPRLSRLGCPLPAVLFWLSCHGCPVFVVLSQLSCPVFSSHPVTSFLLLLFCSQLFCPNCPIQLAFLAAFVSTLVPAVLSKLSCSDCPVYLSCPSCPVPAVPSRLSHPGCPVLDVLS